MRNTIRLSSLLSAGNYFIQKQGNTIDETKLNGFAHSGVTISPAGNYFVCWQQGSSEVQLWHGNGQFVRKINNHTGPITGCTFSHDGNTLLSYSHDGNAVLHVLKDNTVHTLSHGAKVYGGQFSADDKYIATRGVDGKVIVWSASNGQRISQLGSDELYIHDFAFHPGP